MDTVAMSRYSKQYPAFKKLAAANSCEVSCPNAGYEEALL
jgi:hypothetical protein